MAAKDKQAAGRRVDGQCRRIGRLLGRDRRRFHLRRAVDHHRLDRRVRGLAELRGHARQSSGSAPTASRRRRCRASRTCSSGPSPEVDRLIQAGVEVDLSPLPWDCRRVAPQDPRPKSTASPRAACGTAAPRASWAWSTASAASRKRSPRRPSWPSSATSAACAISSGRQPHRKVLGMLASEERRRNGAGRCASRRSAGARRAAAGGARRFALDPVGPVDPGRAASNARRSATAPVTPRARRLHSRRCGDG